MEKLKRLEQKLKQHIDENKKETSDKFNVMIINSKISELTFYNYKDNSYMEIIRVIKNGEKYRCIKVDDYKLFYVFNTFNSYSSNLELNEFVNIWFKKLTVLGPVIIMRKDKEFKPDVFIDFIKKLNNYSNKHLKKIENSVKSIEFKKNFKDSIEYKSEKNYNNLYQIQVKENDVIEKTLYQHLEEIY